MEDLMHYWQAYIALLLIIGFSFVLLSLDRISRQIALLILKIEQQKSENSESLESLKRNPKREA